MKAGRVCFVSTLIPHGFENRHEVSVTCEFVTSCLNLKLSLKQRTVLRAVVQADSAEAGRLGFWG